MIPSGARVFLRADAVDFRKGPDGLVALVRDAGADPFNGALLSLSVEAGGQDQDCLVRRVWVVPVRQASGAIAFCLADARESRDHAEPCAAHGAG